MTRTRTFTNWNSVPLTFGMETACIILDKSDTCLKNEIDAGRLKAIKCGREWVFEKTNVMKYLGAEPPQNECIRQLESQVNSLQDLLFKALERRDTA